MKININKAEKSRIQEVDFNNLVFGKIFSDHMYIVDYINGKWQSPEIKPFGPILMSPSISAIHHGQSIFEGMKAYKSSDNQILLFRPEDNWKRLNISAERMCMPEVPKELFMEGLKTLIDIDRNWVPEQAGSSLYIRPVYFAIDEAIGVKPSENYRLIIMTSPAASYFLNPVKVIVENKFSRSCEGGVGYAKAAGNYGAAMLPTRLAHDKGFHQVIWTDSVQHKYVEESGAMNLMFVINGKLVTPSLSESKLAGITRDSIIKLVKSWNMPVEERNISIDEIILAYNNNVLEEAFGCGTAANIAHIDSITIHDKELKIQPVEKRELSNKISRFLLDIKTGKVKDTFNWTVIV